jgi:hypothetical protein
VKARGERVLAAVKNGDVELGDSNITIRRESDDCCLLAILQCLLEEEKWQLLACASRWGRDEILIARLGGVLWALEHYCAVVPTFSCSTRREIVGSELQVSARVCARTSHIHQSCATVRSSRRVESTSTCNHQAIPLVHCRLHARDLP